MPDLSGLEVARHLRGPDAPIVIFVTAYDRYAVEAFELAALDYVLKPIKRERLAETVRRVIDEAHSGQRSAHTRAIAEVLDSPQLEAHSPPLHRLPVRHRRGACGGRGPLVFSRDRLVLARSGGPAWSTTRCRAERRLRRRRSCASTAALVNLDAWNPTAEDGVLVLKEGRDAGRGERAACGGGAAAVEVGPPVVAARASVPGLCTQHKHLSMSPVGDTDVVPALRTMKNQLPGDPFDKEVKGPVTPELYEFAPTGMFWSNTNAQTGFAVLKLMPEAPVNVPMS
jgi:hypothetical protein